jgi:hypothetical protein
MEHKVHFRDSNGEPLSDPTHYLHLVGCLVYLVVTRLDISYPIHTLSQFVFVPTQIHPPPGSMISSCDYLSLSFLSMLQFVTTSGLFGCYLGLVILWIVGPF